ncbi:hypothetical protein LCGC14_1789070 [marine sediment metagenome]|uniref:Uncharacterized protein n=1 Tax=marine sediment metagenome TaxID=412755 RepID=A0A0F9J7Z3_9ZZZZ
MSDGQKLKDCVAKRKEANKALDDKLNKAEENNRTRRREAAEKSNRQY